VGGWIETLLSLAPETNLVWVFWGARGARLTYLAFLIMLLT
jgi:hypothetical protein